MMGYQELKLLEDDLWEAADQLRANSKLTASEYSMSPVEFERRYFERLESV